ncbi:MAG: hypothetical protein WAK48_11540, partial [Candidatus Acidiferrum sp.]
MSRRTRSWETNPSCFGISKIEWPDHRRHAGNNARWRSRIESRTRGDPYPQKTHEQDKLQRQQGRSGQWRVSSRPAAASLVKPSTTINTGTERIGASDAALPVATCAVRTTRLPVMCAANSPPSPRKLMTNVDGARYDPERARQQLGAERAVPERATARALIRSLAGRVGPA